MQSPARHALLHSGAILASGSSEVKNLDAKNLILIVDVTAIQGTTPTLDVIVEELDPASGKYTQVGAALGTISTVSKVRHTVLGDTTPFGPMLRISWTLGGTATPGFTFTAGLLGNGG